MLRYYNNAVRDSHYKRKSQFTVSNHIYSLLTNKQLKIMKNVKKVMALVAVILGFAVSASAQNGFTLRAGGNFPVGAFNNGENAAELALSNSEATLGGAAIGFNAGVKYQFGVVGNLSAFATADFFYNGLKGDIKEDWHIEDLKDIEGIKFNTPSYMNIPVMLGLNYTILDIIGTTLWAEAGAGVNFRSITKNSAEYNSNNLDVSAEMTYDLATTFAWQAGLGVSIDNTVTLGLHYYGFGKSEIKGESTIPVIGTKSFKVGKLNPSMVVVRLGYTF